MSRYEKGGVSKHGANQPVEKERRRKFRKGLLLSEVYFRTLAALLLSVMAVFVSFEANKISRRQLDVSEKEMEVLAQEMAFLESEKLPFLEPLLEWLPEGNYRFWVRNSGGTVRWCLPLITTFLVMTETDSSGVTRWMSTKMVAYNSSYFSVIQKPEQLGLDVSGPISGYPILDIRPGNESYLLCSQSYSDPTFENLRQSLQEEGLAVGLVCIVELLHENVLGGEKEDTFLLFAYSSGNTLVLPQRILGGEPEEIFRREFGRNRELLVIPEDRLHLSSSDIQRMIPDGTFSAPAPSVLFGLPSPERALEIWNTYEDQR